MHATLCSGLIAKHVANCRLWSREALQVISSTCSASFIGLGWGCNHCVMLMFLSTAAPGDSLWSVVLRQPVIHLLLCFLCFLCARGLKRKCFHLLRHQNVSVILISSHVCLLTISMACFFICLLLASFNKRIDKVYCDCQSTRLMWVKPPPPKKKQNRYFAEHCDYEQVCCCYLNKLMAFWMQPVSIITRASCYLHSTACLQKVMPN